MKLNRLNLIIIQNQAGMLCEDSYFYTACVNKHARRIIVYGCHIKVVLSDIKWVLLKNNTNSYLNWKTFLKMPIKFGNLHTYVLTCWTHGERTDSMSFGQNIFLPNIFFQFNFCSYLTKFLTPLLKSRSQ